MVCAKIHAHLQAAVICRFRHDLKTSSGEMSTLSVERSWRKVCSLPPASGILSDSSVSDWHPRQRLPCCCVKKAAVKLCSHSISCNSYHSPLQPDSHACQPSTESSVKLRVMNYNILGASLVSCIAALAFKLS